MQNMRVLLLLLVSLISVESMQAQRYPISTVSINEGLPQSVVYDMYQDTKGYIWFATQDGVGIFDGKRFTTYSIQDGLIDNMARSIAQDNSNRIWIATDRGLSFYTHAEKKVSTYLPFAGKAVRSLLSYKDLLILGTIENGIYILKDTVQIAHINKRDGLIHPRVFSMAILNDTLYAGTEGGLSLISMNDSFKVSRSLTVKEGLLSNSIRSVLSVNNKEIWISGYGGGISILKYGHLKTISRDQGFPNVKVNQMFEDTLTNTVFVATDGRGLVRVTENKISIIEEEQGLSNTSIQSVLKDTESNIWIGTWGGGAFKLKYTNILLYGKQSGLPENNVTAVYVDDEETKWIGTNNKGLVSIDRKGEKKLYSTENKKLNSNRIFSLAGEKGEVWVGTDNGLIKIKNGKVIHNYFIRTNQWISIRAIKIDNSGDVWIGTFGTGAARLNPKTEKINWFNRENGLLNDSVFAITVRRNDEVWLGSDAGISIIKNNRIIGKRTLENGLINNRVSTIIEDKNNEMWIGTYKSGLSILKKDTIIHYSMSNYLMSNLISFICEDDYGSVWVGTKKGVSRFSPKGLKNYSTQNGLISNETNPKTGFFKKNKMYIGTVKGLTEIDLDHEISNEVPPPIYIEKTSIWGVERDLTTDSVLTSDDNFITIVFTAPHFSNPDQLQYDYRLIGFEQDWNRSYLQRVQYTNLKSGTYTFEVKGVTTSGLVSTEPAQLTFIVLPAFWDTASFRISIFGFITLIIYAGIRLNSERLRKQNSFLESEVKKRTEELYKRDELFRLISENAGDLIAVCDNKAKALYASPSFNQILGYKPSELVGTYIGKLISENSFSEFQEFMHSVFNQNTIRTAEIQLITKENKTKTFLITISYVDSKLNQNSQYVLVGHDISNRKKTEEKLLQSKLEAETANLAKSRFLASMSHELRTPLNAILGFAQILENASDLPQKYRDYVSIMHNSGEHLLSMINDILDLSKIEAGRMEVNTTISSLPDFLYDLENMMLLQARNNNLSLSFDKSPDLPEYIDQDFNKLRQILINLIGNALKYTEKGGVSVFAKVEEENILVFEVRDTGPGIPPEQLEKIFDAFHQVQTENFSKGTGLGLTISMKIAQIMGGKITVYSELGKGSSFKIILPLTAIKQDEHQFESFHKDKVISLKETDKPPILFILDDIDENRAILTEFLRQIGFVCYDYNRAKPALNDLTITKPDLILSDIIMPEMDGKEFLAEVRKIKEYVSIPVIAITASIFAETRTDLIHYGFNEFILKPVNLDLLLKIIAKFIPVEYNVLSEEEENLTIKNEHDTNWSEIYSYTKEFRFEMIEALELLDQEKLQSLLQTMDNKSVVKTLLKEAMSENNYRYIITLTEKLSDISD